MLALYDGGFFANMAGLIAGILVQGSAMWASSKLAELRGGCEKGLGSKVVACRIGAGSIAAFGARRAQHDG